MKRMLFISFTLLLLHPGKAQTSETSITLQSFPVTYATAQEVNLSYKSGDFSLDAQEKHPGSPLPMTVRTMKGNRISGILMSVSDSMISVYPSAKRHFRKGKRYAKVSISYTNIYRIGFRVSNGGIKRIHIVNGDIVKFHAFCKWYADKTKH